MSRTVLSRVLTLTRTWEIVIGSESMWVVFLVIAAAAVASVTMTLFLDTKDWAASYGMEGICAEADAALVSFINEFANAGPFAAMGWRVSHGHCIILQR